MNNIFKPFKQYAHVLAPLSPLQKYNQNIRIK